MKNVYCATPSNHQWLDTTCVRFAWHTGQDLVTSHVVANYMVLAIITDVIHQSDNQSSLLLTCVYVRLHEHCTDLADQQLGTMVRDSVVLSSKVGYGLLSFLWTFYISIICRMLLGRFPSI